jgi:hypothetical protein
MREYANKRLIKRNGRFGRALIYTGLALTVAAAVIVFREPNFIFLALIAMLIGGFLSQIGTALYNRFGREPRMDQVIDASLKGLDDRYAIFHYLLGTDHVLITPEGVLAIIPRWEKGQISYRDGTWFHKKPKGRFTIRSRERALRGVGKEAQRELQSLDRSLKKNLDSSEDLNTQAVLVFIAENANLNLDDAPLLTTHRKKIKATIRNLERGKSLDQEAVTQLGASVGG